MRYFVSLSAVCVLACIPAIAHAKLKVSDFEGNYVSYCYTLGGISGNTGFSSSSVSHLTINKRGHGKINFLSSSLYTGPIGSTLTTARTIDKTANRLRFEIQVKDPKRHAGSITTFNYPANGALLLTDFVAIKRNGKVVEFYQNVVSNKGGTIGATTLIVSKRQS